MPGGVVFHDLRQKPSIFSFMTPLDSVNYFLSQKTLDIIAEDAGAPKNLRFAIYSRRGVSWITSWRELTRLLLPVFRHTRPGLPALRGLCQSSLWGLTWPRRTEA